jgi:hypothetical protein
MRFQRNMGPKERALRVAASAAFYVVGATITPNHIIRCHHRLRSVRSLVPAVQGRRHQENEVAPRTVSLQPTKSYNPSC